MPDLINSETYSFDAIRGIQANREYYVVICPMKIIPKLFIFNEYEIPAKLRAQRTLRESRIPALTNYILSNPKEYIFSSLTASVDGAMKFIPSPHLGPEGKIGRLSIDMSSKLLINDGQHRRKAIESALIEKPNLGNDSISVVFFEDRGLKRSQQMFADLNKNAVKPSKSLNILYDNRDEYSQFIVGLVDNLEIFKNRVELEKTTIGKHAKEVFTLGGISDATKKMLGKESIRRPSQTQKYTIREFWNCVTQHMPEWQLLIKDKITSDDLRAGYVNGHTNCLNALGIVGKETIKQYPDKWKKKLSALSRIDWSRENPVWDGNFIQDKKMVRTTVGIDLGAAAILEHCKISVPKKPKRSKK
ncbi:MAG: DNA sulfur modification protein DndB [Cenarchaeum symbiont of Oopsacas minuta]|nr:DNA sulfur modification protein DndB [Cenarchaeum symbiont of Oopsacas minuta]